MANQSKSDRKDRNGGGDVTKAERRDVGEVTKTNWDLYNNTGAGRFNPSEGE